MSAPFVLQARRLVTCASTSSDPLGVALDQAVVVDAGRIAFVGPRADLPEAYRALSTIDAELVTPGLVDAHTHAAYVGSRHEEYLLKMAGAGYEEIAAAGGGIVSSMRAVRAATDEEVYETLAQRLGRMATLGVTTVEVKSGYGLRLDAERRQLDAARRARAKADLPRVVPTYLALHAVPPEGKADRGAWIDRVVSEDLPAVHAEGLATFCDAYIDRNAFSVVEAERLFRAATHLGLGVRAHVGQFADVGGAELAARFGARSVDHVENIGEAGLDALAAAGVRVGLLPVASFTLAQTPPPVATFRARGIRCFVASDANPGTAPTDSLPLAMAFAVRLYGLTLAETLLGATREAALSLGLDDVGEIRPGFRADLVLWDLPHEAALVQPLGTPRARRVLRDGVDLLAG